MRVLAEHPSELVRDEYLMEVADRLRLEPLAASPSRRRTRAEPDRA